jgi:hypothetical protein
MPRKRKRKERKRKERRGESNHHYTTYRALAALSTPIELN